MWKFIEDVLTYSNEHEWFNWVVGHSILPLVFLGLGWFTGALVWGATVGLVVYWLREIEQDIWPRIKKTGKIKFTRSTVGDLAAPTLIFIMAVIVEVL